MLDLIETRNRHFLDACRRVMARMKPARRIYVRRVALEAALEPAPFYYCTFEYALRSLRVLRHGRLRLRAGRRRDMWTELDARVRERAARTGERLEDALGGVLADGGASQFFISPSTAYNLARDLLADLQ